MNTEQDGSTTTEQANQKVNVTEKLFADLLPVGEVETLPAVNKEVEAKSEEEIKEVKKEVTETPAPTPKEPEYLDIQDFGDKKVTVKIDGVEAEIPFKDVVKGYQTEQYLTRKGQMLAEEKKKLHETPAPPIHTKDDYLDPLMADEVERLNKELETVKEYSKAAISELAPFRYERNLSAIDTEMKAEGLIDFREKVSEIEKIILAMPPEQSVAYDTTEGFKNVYKDLKLRELIKKPQASTTVNPDVRPKPKIVPIESSSSPSGGDTSTTAERNKAFAHAKKTGDWPSFMEKYG